MKAPAKPYLWADFDASLSPSHHGIQSGWSQIENIEWSADGVSGTGCAKGATVDPSLGGSVAWSLRTDYDSWTRDGQRFYIYKKQRQNFSITDKSQNWKIWRMWPAGGRGYPNVYAAANNGRVYV
jgi:hypothetical protein